MIPEFDGMVAYWQTSRQLKHLEEHYHRVGGGKPVIEASKSLRSWITKTSPHIKELLDYKEPFDHTGRSDYDINVSASNIRKKECDLLMQTVMIDYRRIKEGISVFHKSLYHQKHAVYFRRICDWSEFHEVRELLLNIYTCIWCFTEHTEHVRHVG